MIVCSFCEHQQAAGTECEVCGKKFDKGTAIPIEVPPIEGLEPTRFAAAGGPEPVVAPGDWLEPTQLPAAASVEGTAVADLEPTRLAEPAAPSSLEMLPIDQPAGASPHAQDWLEPTLVDTSAREETPAPVTAVCRYCRTPAQPGEKFCGRCGMRLPILTSTPQASAASDLVTCPDCGVPTTPGLCRSCGARLQSEEP